MYGDETISIIVPVYNTAAYLPRCIESVRTQKHDDFELILIDDGSTDNSLEVCQKYATLDNRIKIIHKENGGVSSARNVGIDHVNGKYFMFLDSDDAISDDVVYKAIKTFKENSEIECVVFGWQKIYSDGKLEQYCPDNSTLYNMSQVLYTLLENYDGYGGGYPNKIWKTEAFENNIPRYDTSLYYFEDLEWMTRMFLSIKAIACINQIGYLYYIRCNSITFSNNNIERKEIGYHSSMSKVINVLEDKHELRRWFCDKYYPEIVNGVIFAWLNGYKKLFYFLYKKLQYKKQDIFDSKNATLKIKIRCFILLLFSGLFSYLYGEMEDE